MLNSFDIVSEQIQSPSQKAQQSERSPAGRKLPPNSRKNLDQAQETFEAFLNGKMSGNTALAFEEAFEAWNRLSALKKEYEIAKIIIFEDEKDYGLRHSIRQLLEFVGAIDEYEESELELIKKLGYQNYILPIQKSYQKMLGAFETLESKRNEGQSAPSIEQKKQFINDCLSECGYFNSLPEALDSIGAARAEIAVGERKKYFLVSRAYKELKSAMVSEAAVSELRRVREALDEQVRLFEEPITGAKQCVLHLKNILGDDWFEQFVPGVEGSDLSAVDSKQSLTAFYKDNVEILISEEPKQTD